MKNIILLLTGWILISSCMQKQAGIQNNPFKVDLYSNGNKLDAEFPEGPIKMNTEVVIKSWLDDLDRCDITKYSSKPAGKKMLLIGGWNDVNAPIEGHVLPLFRNLYIKNIIQVINDGNILI